MKLQVIFHVLMSIALNWLFLKKIMVYYFYNQINKTISIWETNRRRQLSQRQHSGYFGLDNSLMSCALCDVQQYPWP